jgi:preprotein translocase subunit SecD
MRRFIAYLVMLLTIVGAVVFNTQAVLANKVDSMEYGKGTQVVYSLDKRDPALYPAANYPDIAASGTENLSDIDIQGAVMTRLDTAQIRNADVKVVTGTEANVGYQLRVSFSPLSALELSNVKEVLGKTGTLSVCTINDYCMYASADQFFNNDEIATVTYNGTTPYPTIHLKNTTDFDTMKKKAEEAATTTKGAHRLDATGDTTANTDAKKLILWVDKNSDDTYAKAFGTNDTVIQQEVKGKVLATLSTDNYNSTDKQITLTSDSSGAAYTTSTARAFVNMLNAKDYGFEISYLYENSLAPTLTAAGFQVTYIALGVTLLIICILLIAFYGLSGISGAVSLVATLFLTFLVCSALGFEFSIGALTGLFVVMALSAFISVCYFEHVKQEMTKGRDAEKANREGYHKAFFPILDVSAIMLITALFGFLLAGGVYKIFFGFIIFGSIFSFFLTNYLNRWMVYWLTKDCGNSTLPFFGFFKPKQPDLAIVSTGKKHFSRKTMIGLGSLGCLLLAIALPVSFATTRGFFKTSDDYASSYTLTIVFRDDDVSYDPLSTKAVYLSYIEKIGQTSDPTFIAVSTDVASTTSTYDFAYDASSAFVNIVEKKDEKNNTYFMHYFSVTVDRDLNTVVLSNQTDTPLSLITNAMADGDITVSGTPIAPGKDSHYSKDSLALGAYKAVPANVSHNTNNLFLVIFLLGIFGAVYVFIRYGLNIALTQFVSTTLVAVFGIGLMSALQIPFNSFTALAALAAVMVAAMLIVPALRGNKERLKEEGIRKTATAEQRADIVNEAASKSAVMILVPLFVLLFLGGALSFVASSLIGFSTLTTVLCLITFFIVFFFAIPFYYFCATHISFHKLQEKWDNRKHFRFGKKKEEKAVADKDGIVYTDPEGPHETIIRGMNDFRVSK